MSTLSINLPKIADYQIREVIHEGDRTLVYRGQKNNRDKPVAIKLMGNKYPSFNELVRFRNQYAIAKNIDIKGIIKTYRLERYENRYALIMEDIDGVSLAQYKENASLSLPQFFKIAIQLADILHHLHQNQIIHKDIKPGNILIHPETQDIKLIDFSISTLLPKETQTIQTPNVLEGTLAYLSPEQTGRMNRGIDYRSDFYSLGVTFYELLAGHVPFNSDDPLELIHAHIARNPEPILDRHIPQMLSDIVVKLMAKNAEDRYQSALGLKHDLEKSLRQYQKTGKIVEFELGERDLCDRFNIPEKLYGREAEVQTLLNAFDRIAEGNSEMILVAGFSGIGKTAVINEVHKPIVRNRGYFVKGKFDQFNRNIPFSAFVQAFRDLMRQLLGENDTVLANWREQILAAVGENGQLLVDVIPELKRIIGEQPPVPELSGMAAQNRFNLLLQKFIAVVTTQEHPLAIFLDDLQWADSASLNLLKVLMGDTQTGYLLLLGAYRDNEVYPAHPFMLALADLEKQNATISTIALSPLSVSCINQLVSETLSCEKILAAPLTDLIYQKTTGNPFFTTQFLRGLYEDELIAFNPDLGYWECDLVKVQDAALTDDVVEFMASRLHKLPEDAQNILKLAACIGNQFDLETLAIICATPVEKVATNLWDALREGLIVPQSEAYKFFQGEEQDGEKAAGIAVGYRFLHDRVQQAAYSLIPEDCKHVTHLNIGRFLLEGLSQAEERDEIFTIVNQLNWGSSLIEDEQERENLARLNCKAGQKAKLATAFISALKYARKGLELLSENAWKQQYELSLELHQLVAEAAYSAGDFEAGLNFIEIALKSARISFDKVKFYQVKIDIYVAQKQGYEAIEVGRQILGELGIELPYSLTPEETREIFANAEASIPEGGFEALFALPTSTDPTVIAVMETLATLSTPIFTTNPALFPLLFSNLLDRTLKQGTTAFSAVGYSHYSILLCNVFNDLEAAYQFGELALKLLPRFQNKIVDTQVLCVAGCATHHWKIHLRETLPFYEQGAVAALEVGDLLNLGWNYVHESYTIYLLGTSLPEAAKQVGIRNDVLRKAKQESHLLYNETLIQSILNLHNPTENPCYLTINSLDEDELVARAKDRQDTVCLFFFYFCKLQLCYLLGHYKLAVKYANLTLEYSPIASSYPTIPVMHFYIALANLALWNSSRENGQGLEKIQVQYEKLESWSHYGPMNCQHKFLLLEAEKQRILDNKAMAIECYDRAIAAAKENGYIQEEALANELAAKFYLGWDKEQIACVYMQEAYYCYARWEAQAKINHLEQHYPELLKPILQRDKSLEDCPSPSATKSMAQIPSTCSAETATIADISSILDFSSLLRASQTLSGEIELDRLLSMLMKIILENAGATKGALLLTNETGLTVEAIATRTEAEKKFKLDRLNRSISLEDYPHLPAGLINTVRRTAETTILDAKTAQDQFAADRYLLHCSPQSLLCMPLLERGNLMGILYLENTIAANAFTRDRVNLLDALCVQAAISLTNARLYQQAKQALTDLQQAQLQLVQSEKMSALGNLVAGVAHEINNPVGFIAGNLDPARDYLDDLFGLIDIYQQEYPEPNETVQAEIEDIDLDFLRSDLPQLISSMREGCDRICHISTSLRTFSRTDKEYKVLFNLHDGIDSTLLILKHRLKANENRPAIEIIKNYGELPEVECFPGQLNQVFMNLIANSIDALEESNVGCSFDEISNRITISTSATNGRVIIHITDNGMGMPKEVQERIFEQGFTTKGVGKGTGLGMAIAHQIIVENHGGSICCNSVESEYTEFAISIPVN